MFMSAVTARFGVIILHASESGGTIEFWGELSGDDPASGRKARGSRHPHSVPDRSPIRAGSSGKKARGSRHPYSVPAREIMDRLKSHMRIGRGQHYPSTKIWLPSGDGRPLPSDGTALGQTKFDPKADLKKWTVQSVIFPPKETARILLEAVRNRSVMAGMAVGPDLAYWSDVARFAGSIVARQQFLPDLSYYYRARAGWTPVFLGEDHERLIALAKRMPMAACALAKPYGGAFSADSPVLLVIRWLSTRVTFMECSAALGGEPKEFV